MKKNAKCSILLLLVFLLCLPFAACSSSTSEHSSSIPEAIATPSPTSEPTTTSDLMSETVDENELDEMAAEFHEKVSNYGIALGNMLNYEANYLKALGDVSDTMVDHAFEWLEDNSDYTRDDVEAAYDEITDLYGEIAVAGYGDVAIPVMQLVEDEYSAYFNLYFRATTNPSSLESFTTFAPKELSALNDCIKEMDKYFGNTSKTES